MQIAAEEYVVKTNGKDVTVRNVPCYKCDHCGEVVFSASVIENLDDVEENEMSVAFERLQKWREENRDYFAPNFDWKKEYHKALDEKYGLDD